ncbi:6765_t:CDS:2, partial [Racocetra persica]
LPNNNDEYYVELLYGELDETINQNLSTNISSDNEIIELAIRAKQALNISRGPIEPPVIITNLLKQIKATIYLSIYQYWDSPKEIILISALLDPDTKSLKLSDNLVNDLSKLLSTSKLSKDNYVNYSLLRLSDDSDKEKNEASNKVIQYLVLSKEAQEYN